MSEPIQVRMTDDVFRDYPVVSAVNYLKICAHCGECLKQIVASQDKLNVVLHYRDDTGTIVEWKPTKPQSGSKGASKT